MLQSPFWSYDSIALVADGEACLFDPGGRPEDVAALRDAVRARGALVRHVVLTHSHHDHLRGWDEFPEARLWLPAAAAAKPREHKQRDVAFQEVIDERLGRVGAARRFPDHAETFAERAAFTVGALEVELRFLPGHSLCTSVAFVPAERALVSADYLVSPGLPYCRWQPRAFEAAMVTLRAWCAELAIERVLPAHHAPIEGHAAVLAAIDAERAYFAFLRERVRALLAEGVEPALVTRRAAAEMRARRGPSLGARARQDGDNARRVVAEERGAALS
ncbi:MAG: MBL fold metallo-hydrolase [Planctomycetes bacterium]|nr:MBL fold metallo-hydrolase [Planctomycetota bacterium]